MKSLPLTVARFASAAWVGAAALFVVTAVREVRHPEFDSAIKDRLALLRFPAYYWFGFALVAVAAIAAMAASVGHLRRLESNAAGEARRIGSPRIFVAVVLLVVALAIMLVDFAWVYQPMSEMITPPGRARAAEFQWYHRASMWLNTCDVAICAIASVLLCWPEGGRSSPTATG